MQNTIPIPLIITNQIVFTSLNEILNQNPFNPIYSAQIYIIEVHQVCVYTAVAYCYRTCQIQIKTKHSIFTNCETEISSFHLQNPGNPVPPISSISNFKPIICMRYRTSHPKRDSHTHSC